MKRVIAIADRVAIPCLKLIAAVNILFLLSFLLVLALASRQAHAEMPVCTGKDMMAELAARRCGAARQDRAGGRRDAERQGPAVEDRDRGQRAFLSVRHHAHDRPARDGADARGAAGL